MKNFILIRFFTTSSAFSAPASSVSLHDQTEQIRAAEQVPALAALLLQNGKVVASVAVGVRKLGDPTLAQADDKFHLGSGTKAMTATLVAMFIDDGKLSWTSTLFDLFPEIANMHPAFKTVTVEMLLAHRSGLTADLGKFNGGTLWSKLQSATLDPVEGRQMLAREMLSQPPASPPGSKYEYSNQGYALLGAILERISGTPWEELIHDRLFKPLNMGSCGIGPLGNPGALTPDQPWAHQKTAAGIHAVFADNPETLGPAATVHCSMLDWAKFIQLHIDAFNGQAHLVTASSFSKLHSSYPGQEYTYGGWIKTDRAWAKGPVFTHDGSNTLNYATVWWAPIRNFAVMSVSNIGAPAGQKATMAATASLLDWAQ